MRYKSETKPYASDPVFLSSSDSCGEAVVCCSVLNIWTEHICWYVLHNIILSIDVWCLDV